MLKAIHAQDGGSAQDKCREAITKLKALRLTKAAELVEAKAHETLTSLRFRAITGGRSKRTIRSSG